jgi:NAD+ kinase
MKKSHFLFVPDHVTLDQNIRYLLAKNFALHNVPMPSTDYIIVAGGDGTMLRIIRKYRELFNPEKGRPIFFGLNYGHAGFLMNEPKLSVIQELEQEEIEIVEANLLRARIETEEGAEIFERAFNDFYFRAPEGTAKIRVAIDGEVVRQRMVCDGVIVCTAFGSTAYNASARGPVLTYGARNQMVLTAISPTLFANWRNLPLEKPQVVTLETLETEYNPVNFYADGVVYKNVRRATIWLSDVPVRIAFAASQRIRQRHMRLQLTPETSGE